MSFGIPARLSHWVESRAARPLRFVGTGGVAAAFQLSLLGIFLRGGMPALPSDAIAFLAAAQVNFGLSCVFTWRDRLDVRDLRRRWLLYHVSISIMAVANFLTFVAARNSMPVLPAALAGIAVGAAGNYLAGDRLVFRARAGTRSNPDTHNYTGIDVMSTSHDRHAVRLR